jgi:iron complex outermembrane receptor protein
MSTLGIATRKCARQPVARLARLVACAGVLAAASTASAQAEPAPPSEESPAPAPPSPDVTPGPSPAPPEPGAEPLPEDPPEVYEGELAEVVVTGFRVSLGAALQKKQRATGQVDAIVAEDIAEFPDLNLAESLQRIPGVAITRSNGEGSQITVRGLPGLYTRIRVNGMEVRANVGNGSNASGAGGRGFDFNLFASELFNSIVVHKTASAELDEGSLGAVVDLNTARAFNYDEGWTFVAGATGVYNDLRDTVRPRLTGLIAYRDPDNVWGATASAAYQRVRLDQVSIDTVNWQKAPFRSVNGVTCATNPADPGCAEVADAFHPRIPRFATDTLRGDRLGLTAGIQLRPTDLTEIRLDALYATYPSRNDQRRLGPYFRGNEGTTDISNYMLTAFPDRFGIGNDSLIAADADNTWMRAEHVRLDSVARFYQLGLGIDQRITDSFRVDAFAGTSRSKSGLSHDTTVNYDNRTYDGFRFDYTDDEAPLLAFNGPNVTDPSVFVVPELRDRVGSIKGGFDTAELNLHLDVFDELKLAAGVNVKRATYETQQGNRDGTVCALGLYDCDTNDDGTNEVLGPPGDPALTEWVDYPGAAGAGSTTRWASPTIDGWVDFFGYYNAPLILTEAATNKVTETNLGYYLQARGEVMLGSSDMRLLYDAGVRYVDTRQSSTGYRSGVLVTIDRPTYQDLLPAANTALWFTDEVVLRLAAARVMARPALGDLSPGAGVDSFGYAINFQNPDLDPTRATALDAAAEWYFADGSLLSLAVFWKDIDSFPIRASRRGTFESTDLPRSVIQPLSPADVSGPGAEGTCGDPAGCWAISELSNGPGSKVKGLEIGFQAPFRAFYGELPPIIADMGILANYTYVDSDADYTYFTNTVRERLIGLSNGQYNATLYYDDSTFSARASLAYRSDFLTGGPNSQGNLWDFTEASTRLDASTSYTVTKHLKISLEALNLTDTPVSSRVDIDAERRNLYNRFGRTYLLGARLSY